MFTVSTIYIQAFRFAFRMFARIIFKLFVFSLWIDAHILLHNICTWILNVCGHWTHNCWLWDCIKCFNCRRNTFSRLDFDQKVGEHSLVLILEMQSSHKSHICCKKNQHFMTFHHHHFIIITKKKKENSTITKMLIFFLKTFCF